MKQISTATATATATETVTLTTHSLSCASTKGRMKTIDESLPKIRDHLAMTAKKFS